MVKLLQILIFFCLLINSTYSNIDSLKRELNTAKSDISRIGILLNLANDIASAQPKQSIIYANEGLLLSQKSRNLVYYPDLLMSKAIALIYDNNFVSSEENISEAIGLIKTRNQKLLLAKYYSQKGSIYYKQSNFQKASENFDLSLDIFNKLGDKEGLGTVYSNYYLLESSQNNFDKALNFLELSLKNFKDINNIYGITSVNINKCSLLKNSGKYKESLDHLLKIKDLVLSTNFKDLHFIYFSELGSSYYCNSMNFDALQSHKKALKLAIELNDLEKKASALNDIGIIFSEIKENENASKYFKEAISLYKKLNLQKDAARTSLNLVSLFSDDSSKFSENLKELNELKVIFTNLKDMQAISTTLINISSIYSSKKNYDEASKSYYEALKIAEQEGDNIVIAHALIGLGNIENTKKNFKKSIDLLERGKNIAELTGNIEIIKDAYKFLAESYSNIHRYDKAYFYEKKYSNLNDIFLKEESDKQIAILNFKERETELNNEMKEKERIQEKELKEKNSIIIIFVVISISVFIVCILLIIVFRISRKLSKSLRNKNKQLVLANQEKELYLSTINYDLKKASEYLVSLLPPKVNDEHFKVDWVFEPSTQIGGDSFGYEKIGDDHYVIYLIDVSGHGVSSALHSVAILNSLKFEDNPIDRLNPVEVALFLNKSFNMMDHNEMFFTLWYGVYRISTNELTYVGAGHPPALLITDKAEYITLESQNIFIGATRKFKFNSTTIQIEPNSRLYVFSDGSYEIKKQSGKYIDINEFYQLILSTKADKEQLQKIYNHTLNINHKQSLDDDFSILKLQLH